MKKLRRQQKAFNNYSKSCSTVHNITARSHMMLTSWQIENLFQKKILRYSRWFISKFLLYISSKPRSLHFLILNKWLYLLSKPQLNYHSNLLHRILGSFFYYVLFWTKNEEALRQKTENWVPSTWQYNSHKIERFHVTSYPVWF